MRAVSDLYDALGLTKSASVQDIHRAYRKASKAAHPDMDGGSEEKFSAVALAREVLSDPERRARYDATGEYEAGAVDNTEAELMNLIAGCLDKVVGECVQSGRDPEREDLISWMVLAFKGRSEPYKTQKRSVELDLKRWERLSVKFERKGDGANRLHQIAMAKVAGLQGIKAQCDTEIARTDRALAFLAEYRFVTAGAAVPRGLNGASALGAMW